jgi:hypothetical protein
MRQATGGIDGFNPKNSHRDGDVGVAGIVGEVAAAQGRAVGRAIDFHFGTPPRVSNNRGGKGATAFPLSVW